MSLHALSALDDALAATRKYRPRGPGQWLWVILVTLFVGSPALSVPTGGGSGAGGGTGSEFSQGPDAGPPAPEVGMELVVAVVAVLVAVWLLVAVLGALLEFPFLHWSGTARRPSATPSATTAGRRSDWRPSGSSSAASGSSSSGRPCSCKSAPTGRSSSTSPP